MQLNYPMDLHSVLARARLRVRILLAAWLITLVSGCTAIKQHHEFVLSPGAGRWGHCAEFAVSVSGQLRRQGIPALYVEFAWADKHHKTGLHAVVLFERAGHSYIIDNQTPYPRRTVSGDTFSQVKSYFPDITSIKLTMP
jgi:predicted transglutaminase-like cysteine proteinase